ncbi:hypothetical protein NEFER03_1375 [Nematocida sp. LUAm3]|nr:hypothetical protein NEFER03_1375 [Nematocida sp. LUAm3]KAI5174795.1 hypothetical protein NEFER02_0905 [Nematocida sp. LUAm2]KAI5177794.1 hypothetical protein NEFER01_0996 [Nematocida sp. LUAm1]
MQSANLAEECKEHFTESQTAEISDTANISKNNHSCPSSPSDIKRKTFSTPRKKCSNCNKSDRVISDGRFKNKQNLYRFRWKCTRCVCRMTSKNLYAEGELPIEECADDFIPKDGSEETSSEARAEVKENNREKRTPSSSFLKHAIWVEQCTSSEETDGSSLKYIKNWSESHKTSFFERLKDLFAYINITALDEGLDPRNAQLFLDIIRKADCYHNYLEENVNHQQIPLENQADETQHTNSPDFK